MKENTLRRQEKKQQLVAYKGGKCFDCGGTFPQCCFHFDHRNPWQKSFGISREIDKPIAELMIEADKCDLVCANCHAIRTAGNPVIVAKISAAMKGKKASRATRRKMSLSHKGIPKPCSPTRATKTSIALKGKPWSPTRRAAQKVK